jgi:hypothetical protein
LFFSSYFFPLTFLNYSSLGAKGSAEEKGTGAAVFFLLLLLRGFNFINESEMTRIHSLIFAAAVFFFFPAPRK